MRKKYNIMYTSCQFHLHNMTCARLTLHRVCPWPLQFRFSALNTYTLTFFVGKLNFRRVYYLLNSWIQFEESGKNFSIYYKYQNEMAFHILLREPL